MDEMSGDCSARGRWEKAELKLGQAEAVLWQGRTTEAETLAREAFQISTATRVLTLNLLSDIFFEQGRFEDSFRVALGAIARLDEMCAPSDALQRGRAYEATGRALNGLSRWDDAAKAFATLEQLMQTDQEVWNRWFRVNRDRGIALLRSGDIEGARNVLDAVASEQTIRLGPQNYQTTETRAFLAMALAASGDHSRALAQMRETDPWTCPGRSRRLDAASIGAFGAGRGRCAGRWLADDGRDFIAAARR